MSNLNEKEERHYIVIDEKLCNGCVLCMKLCPTRAIRIKEHSHAVIEGICIDCGECIRVCPQRAIKAITTLSCNIDKKNAVITVSPVLYTQFGEPFTPEEINGALKEMGFFDVIDQSNFFELFSSAVDYYILMQKDKKDSPRPLISPICPVVNRIILNRFPSLLKNIPPILPPRELAAREIRKKVEEKFGKRAEKIKIFHITPSSAKMISIKKPLLINKSNIDGAIGINNIYHDILKALKENRSKTTKPIRATISWGMSGGEIGGMENGNFLAVSGLEETIRYLGKIELGLLKDIDYIEFRTCAEGCIGGPLTVADKYQAKHTINRLIQLHGTFCGEKNKNIGDLFDQGWFKRDKDIEKPARDLKSHGIEEAINRRERVENVHKKLPGKECGVCGSPDCYTFAEDVADGYVELNQCVCLKTKNEGERQDES